MKSREQTAIEALLKTWTARSSDALPADAMLINRHIRELREAIHTPAQGSIDADGLPPLPEPLECISISEGTIVVEADEVYSADQLRAAILADRAARQSATANDEGVMGYLSSNGAHFRRRGFVSHENALAAGLTPLYAGAARQSAAPGGIRNDMGFVKLICDYNSARADDSRENDVSAEYSALCAFIDARIAPAPSEPVPRWTDEQVSTIKERAAQLLAKMQPAQIADPEPVPQGDMPIGHGDPMAFFADFCERNGYASDSDMDAVLQAVFYEGIRYCSIHTPATAPTATSGGEAVAFGYVTASAVEAMAECTVDGMSTSIRIYNMRDAKPGQMIPLYLAPPPLPATDAASVREVPTDEALEIFFNEHGFYPNNLGDTTRFFEAIRALISKETTHGN